MGGRGRLLGLGQHLTPHLYNTSLGKITESESQSNTLITIICQSVVFDFFDADLAQHVREGARSLAGSAKTLAASSWHMSGREKTMPTEELFQRTGGIARIAQSLID